MLNGVGLKYFFCAFKMCTTRKDWHVSANGMLLLKLNGENCEKVMLRIISSQNKCSFSFTFMRKRVEKRARLFC